MITGCIRHPEDHPLVMIRQWQIEFCDGNHCAAALLSFFEFFHNSKAKMAQWNSRANDIAERHGDERHQDETLYQYHTKEELCKRLLGLYGKGAIAEGIRILCEKGAITTHRNPNPRYTFDNTIYYQFHPTVCNHWLAEHYPLKPTDPQRIDFIEKSDVGTVESETETNRRPKTVLRYASFEPIEQPKSDTRCIQNQPIDTPKMIRPSSENERPSSEIGRTIDRDKQTKITNKEAAAEASEGAPNKQRIAAASFLLELNPDDLIIRTALSDNQRNYLHQVVRPLLSKLQLDNPRVLAGIEHSLLDPHQFTQAGDDFIKKLNTIVKCLQSGKWTIPVTLIKQAEKIKASRFQTLTAQKSGLIAELNTLKRLWEHAGKRQDERAAHTFARQIETTQHALKKVETELAGTLPQKQTDFVLIHAEGGSSA